MTLPRLGLAVAVEVLLWLVIVYGIVRAFGWLV